MSSRQVPPNAYKPGTKLTVGSHQISITKYLSEGGYAHVYTCEMDPPYDGNKVGCLKRVAVPDKITLNILRAEVDAMKRLKGNKHIVSYIDSHAARMTTGIGYEVFLLMEYCSRDGLLQLMNTRLVHKLTEPEILEIMAHITEGVCNMHALEPPLLHRDIKIENVLVSKNGDFKLCDFGSASGILRPPRNVEEFKILQDDIMKHTTVQYRAPEMIDLYRGYPIDEKSDVWALGVFLYKLCYYTTPFENNHINGNNGGGEMAILSAKYTFPHSPVFSARLKNIMSKILVADPRRRPNAYQLLEEVCKLRNKPVPLENWYSKRRERGVEIKPQMPARPQPQPSGPVPTITKGYNTPPNNIPSLSPTITQWKKTEPYSSNNSKSQPSLNSINLKSTTPSSSSLHKATTDIHDNDKFMKPVSIPSRPTSRPTSRNPSNGTKRPTSMYVSDNHKSYMSSSENLDRLKDSIKGPMETVEFEPDPKQHIDSNVDFLRNLNNQDTGKSLWKSSQNTGDSIKSTFGRISRNNTGMKKTADEKRKNRNSISGLKSLLTGDKQPSARGHMRSKSRTPSTEGSGGLAGKSTDSLSGFQSMHVSKSNNFSDHSVYSGSSARSSQNSSDSIKESPEPVAEHVHSIQSRVKMLLNRSQDNKPTKSASGYGKYTEASTVAHPPKINEPVVAAATAPQRKITPQNGMYKTTSSTSTYSTLTPQSTLGRANSTASQQAKKKAPPPKPKKPTFLRSPPKKVGLKPDATKEQQRLSIDSEVEVDVDDLEKEFNKRFPSAL